MKYVGKSAFLVRLVTGRFLSHYASDIDMTAECDLLSDENDKVKLHITDPAGSLTVSGLAMWFSLLYSIHFSTLSTI